MKVLVSRLKKSKLLSGSFWTIIGSGGARGIMVLGTILTANILGAEKYGEFGLTRSTINMILTIGGLNIGTVITKYVSEFRETDQKKMAVLLSQNYFFVLSLVLVLSSLLYFNSGFISNYLIKSPKLEPEIKLSVFIIFFGIITPLNEAVFRGLELFKKLGFLQIIGALFFVILIPLGACYYSVLGALFGYLVYTLVTLLFSSIILYKIFKENNLTFLSFDENVFKFRELMNLSLPVFLTSLVDAPFFWYAQLLLISYTSFSENGIAAAIMQVRNLILIVPGYVAMVSLPLLTKAVANKNEALYKKYYNKSIFLNLIISLGCILPFLFFSKEIMNLFGKEFIVDFKVILIAFISIPFLTISSLANQSLISKNKGWINFYIAIFWNSIFIGLAYYFLKYLKMGVYGYFLAMFIGILVFTGLKMFFNQKNNINE